jgi:prolyl-tRNA synthetase
VQVVVLAVRTEDGAGEAASALASSLKAAGLRVELDTRTELSFGRRVVGWELKGVPVRVEVGPRDLATGTVTLCRRDTATKSPVRLDDAVSEVDKVMELAQTGLLSEARQRLETGTVNVSTLAEAEQAAQSGFAILPGSLLDGGEDKLNAGGISVRVLQRPDGTLPLVGEDVADLVAVAARAY